MSRRKKSRRGRLRHKKRRLTTQLPLMTEEEVMKNRLDSKNPRHQKQIEQRAARQGLIGKLNGDKPMKPEMPTITKNLALPTVEKEPASRLPKWHMRFPFLKDFAAIVKDMDLGYGMTISDEWIFSDIVLADLTTQEKQRHIRTFDTSLRTMLRTELKDRKFTISALSADRGNLYIKIKGLGSVLQKPDLFKGYRLTRVSNDAKEAKEDPITTMAESRKMENGANDEKWSVKLDHAAKRYIEDAAYDARVSMRKYLHNLIDADMRRSTH